MLRISKICYTFLARAYSLITYNNSSLTHLSGYQEYQKTNVAYWLEDVILKVNVALLYESIRKTRRGFLTTAHTRLNSARYETTH